MTHRAGKLAKVHIAKKDLGLDDDTYRLMLQTRFAVSSARDLDNAGLDAVIAHFVSLGWQPKPKDGRPTLSPSSAHRDEKTQADKIRALWIILGKEGIIRSPSEYSLNAYVRRITNVRRVDWLESHQANAVISALKAMAKRANFELEK